MTLGITAFFAIKRAIMDARCELTGHDDWLTMDVPATCQRIQMNCGVSTDALTLGGQILANGMGLGFAFNIDPLRGVTTPALGQFYTLLGILVFLALDGHIALIQTLISSFHGLPVGPAGLSPAALHSLADWGDELFLGALRVALPGMTALLVVNLAFGVTSRAAPALNLFAVGFPVTLIFGFVIVLLGLPGLQSVLTDLVSAAFRFMDMLVGGG